MANSETKQCPSAGEIEALANGDDVPETVRSHAANCPSCREQIDEIHANQDFLRRAGGILRQAAADPRARAQRSETPIAGPTDSLPGYALLEEISRGGQGIVFRAMQIATKRPAAVKMLLGGEFASPRQRSRFEREIEIAARLRHPNIVTVFESGETAGGHPYVAMEFVEGIALDAFVEKSLPRPQQRNKAHIDEIARLMASIASAVGAAHTAGVIHRDLKPSNIIVNASGVPRVLDFGLARQTVSHVDTTRTQEFVGTPAFAAPEQFRAAAMVDARNDVYSLGLVLYLLICGDLPYPTSSTFAEVARHAASTEARSISTIVPRVPRDLETIIRKCLEKDPDRRYASGAALEADLTHYLHNEAIDARRDSPWYMLKKAVLQNRRLLMVAAAVLAVIGINAYLLLDQMFIAQTARRAAELEQKRADIEAVRSEGTGYILQALLPPGDWFVEHQSSPLGWAAYQNLLGVQMQIEYGGFSERPDLELTIYSTLAGIYSNSANLRGEGESVIRQALAKRIETFGPDHVETATGYYELAEMLLVRKRLSDAAEPANTSLSIRMNRLGATSPAVGRSCEQLARIAIEGRDVSAAVDFGERAVSILDHSGTGARDRSAALRTLAEARLLAGKTESARDLAGRAMRHAAELQDNDPVLLACLELGARMGDWKSADGTDAVVLKHGNLQSLCARMRARSSTDDREISIEMLGVREALLGKAHRAIRGPLTAIANQEYLRAVQAFDFGQVDQGRKLYGSTIFYLDSALPLMESEWGSDSLVIASACDRLSHYAAFIRRFDDAIAYAERSWLIYRAQPDRELSKFDLAIATRWYAWFFCLIGDGPSAEFVSRDAIRQLRGVFSADHYAIATAQAQLAWGLILQGRSCEALDLACESYDVATKSVAIPDDQRAWIGCILGLAMVESGKAQQGAELIDACLPRFWNQRATYPLAPFLNAARRGYIQSGDQQALERIESQWSDIVDR